MRQLPPLNALKAFDAAARHRSFTKAADELHVTHGAVSRQVATLESHFRIALFIRGSRALTLTQEGIKLAHAVERAFDNLLDASDALHQLNESGSTLRVSVPPSLAMWWLMPRLSELDNTQPGFQIELSTSIEPVDFEQGGYDAAIRRIDATPRGLRAERFLDGGSVPVCSPQYQRNNEVFSPQDLVRATLLVSRSENNAWSEWMRGNGIRRAPDAAAKVFDQLYFALVAAMDSLGVALAPIALVQEEVRKGNLCIIAGELVPARRAYALLCPRTSPKLDAVLAFGRWLKHAAPGAKGSRRGAVA
ncbi:LysR substrate-binding domain-containing protein [Bordetella tumulicola]|uniref:LysR substrate-binding domain-containing protein n=1 Tax=Bordetella tumulicola TaxID=1649133 RepID=UPI0039F008F9